jgi:hypothetical protein
VTPAGERRSAAVVPMYGPSDAAHWRKMPVADASAWCTPLIVFPIAGVGV